MNCRICDSSQTQLILSLGHQPATARFLTKQQLNEPEPTYPLDVYFCENCCLVQLGYAVDPKELFSEYYYETRFNKTLRDNFKELVDMLVKRFSLTSSDLAIDLGSNDGTLLANYMPHGVKILGVEPSNVADTAIKNNIPTVKAFFSEELSNTIAEKHGNATIITATNVFAHIKEYHSFVKGIKHLLTKNGVFVSETHYLRDMVEGMQYDSIYHEHLMYQSLKPLIHLFKLHGMEVIDAERITTHGGSLRVFAAHAGAHPISDKVKKLLQEEHQQGLHNLDQLQAFGKRVIATKRKLQKLLLDIKDQGKTIVGIGAPAKGNTLLNYCNITRDVMDYTVEPTGALKIGAFTPGMHIPIKDEQLLFSEQPDYALLLSWNLKDILVPKLQQAGFKGSFIIPNPDPHVVK